MTRRYRFHPRPPMPERVKRAALFRNMRSNGGELCCAETGETMNDDDILKGRIHFDHNPPLGLRAFEDGKYRPDANDPKFIDVVGIDGHAIRTNEKRGLYNGDQTQIAHNRAVRQSHAEHRAQMMAKNIGISIETARKVHGAYDEGPAWCSAHLRRGLL